MACPALRRFLPRFTPLPVALAAALGALFPGALRADNADCLSCHSDETLTWEKPGGVVQPLFVDEAAHRQSAHTELYCLDCHDGLDEAAHPDEQPVPPVNCATCHEEIGGEDMGLHHLPGRAGPETPVLCWQCHGKHDVLPATHPDSRLHYTRQVETCGSCHAEIAQQARQSVHGMDILRGNREAPTCGDCHFEHHFGELDALALRQLSEQVCSRCHASTRMNIRYRLPGDRVQTYFDSYHGLASQGGDTRAANCASCHGVHDIRNSSDPRSSIHPANLRATCGQCHPGASDNFIQGKIHTNGHTEENTLGPLVNFWIRQAYLALIVGVIGFMILHNGLAWRKKAAASFHSPDRHVPRLSRPMRWQHAGLALSFIYLSVSGFALKFPNSWVSALLGDSESFRRLSHRWTGVFLLLLGLFHLAYLAFTADGRRWVRDMWPRWEDAVHLWQNLRYFSRRGAPRPTFRRFGYPEKMEYWAVIWGMIIMGLTGLAIWGKLEVTTYLPRWVIDVATTIHYYEAILAVLAIIAWHFYHVIFDPDVYPVNWSFWDGKVHRRWYEHEHGLDEETLRTATGSGQSPSDPPGSPPSDHAPRPNP